MKKNLTLSGKLNYVFQGVTLTMLAMLVPQLGHAQSTSVVISEVYGGGGNVGAPYDHDLVELYNKTGVGIDLNGYSVQYNPATGGGNYNTVPLGNVTIPANGFLLVQFGAKGTIGAALPTPDVISALDLGATAGRVALVNNATSLKNSDQANELGAGIIDFVGYGSSAFTYEGASQAPVPSNSTSIEQKARISATSVSMALGGDDANQGNSTQLTVHAGLDSKAPASRLYYRLRQVDLDGTVAYSTVVIVAGTNATLTELVVYPNPTAGRLTATLPVASGRTYRVAQCPGPGAAPGLGRSG